jgi:DNA-binding beta-propeller fold protein YncE
MFLRTTLFTAVALGVCAVGAAHADVVPSSTLYVTNELPNANSAVSSVSAYDLTTKAFLGNLVPTSPYGLPDAIVVDSTGNVYVADANGDRVVGFNAAGTQVGVFSTLGGSSVSPTGLAIDPAGTVYASVLNGTIQKISGGVVTTIGTVPNEARGIAYDPYNGLLYITTQSGGNIYTMPTTGGSATLFDSALGSGNLRGLAFGNGKLYVSDTAYGHTNGSIYEFIGSSHVPVLFASSLQGPNYIAIDPLGNLYVAEYFGNDVLELASNGTNLGSFITGLDGPSGIALGPESTGPVPEPSTLELISAGVFLLAAVGRWIRR